MDRDEYQFQLILFRAMMRGVVLDMEKIHIMNQQLIEILEKATEGMKQNKELN